MTDLTPGDLIRLHQQLKGWLEAETKKMNEFFAPHRQKLEEFSNKLQEMMNNQKVDSFKSEFGTAYKSTISSYRILDRDKFIDYCLDNWDDGGNEMLMISAPQKDAAEAYQNAHKTPPPGTDVSSITRVNIRKA